MMRAIRDNETAAAALGKDIAFRRLEAFVFGACLMGLGGALLAHFNRSITPEAIDPMIATFLIWIMLILGGSGNNRGAILGAAVVWIIWSMTEMLADLLPTELAIQAKRSEEHTSELQSLMRISYAVFCLKQKQQAPMHHTYR